MKSLLGFSLGLKSNTLNPPLYQYQSQSSLDYSSRTWSIYASDSKENHGINSFYSTSGHSNCYGGQSDILSLRSKPSVNSWGNSATSFVTKQNSFAKNATDAFPDYSKGVDEAKFIKKNT